MTELIQQGTPLTNNLDQSIRRKLPGYRLPQIDLRAVSANPRPLGIALDWIEIERRAEGGTWVTAPATLGRALVLILGLWLLLLAAGSKWWAALAAAFGLWRRLPAAWLTIPWRPSACSGSGCGRPSGWLA